MNWRFAGLGVFHQLDDLRQGCVGADGCRLEDQRSGAIDGAGDELVARGLGHRQAFAGDQGFVEFTAPFQDLAVDRYALARLKAKALAQTHRFDGDLDLLAVPDHTGLLRPQIHERVDRAGG